MAAQERGKTAARDGRHPCFARCLVDHPESYDEYSCTCMIGFAMQRGIRRGRLNDDYRPCVDKAWRAVEERTGADGKLVNVCTSTGKQKTLRGYLERPAINGRDRGGAMGQLFATELLASKYPGRRSRVGHIARGVSERAFAHRFISGKPVSAPLSVRVGH
jgi:hypothetical protein